MIRRMDADGRLLLTDISEPTFETPGVEYEDLMKQIHGRYPNGEFVLGVEVFREMYRAVGFGRAVAASQWPVFRQLLGAGYWVFAKIRYWTAINRVKRRIQNNNSMCDSTCEITSSSDRMESTV